MGKSQIFLGAKGAYVKMNIESAQNVAYIHADQGAKWEGHVEGGKAGYFYLAPKKMYGYLSAEYLAGDLSHSFFPNRSIKRGEVETRIGYTYTAMQSKKLLVTPYVGPAFYYERQMREPFGGSLTPVLFEYFDLYLPVGFLLDYTLYSFFHMGFHFQWRPDLDPTLKVETLPNQRWRIRRKTKQFLVELPFDFWVGTYPRVKFSLVPFWEERKEGATVDLATLGIPENRITSWGAQFFLAVQF